MPLPRLKQRLCQAKLRIARCWLRYLKPQWKAEDFAAVQLYVHFGANIISYSCTIIYKRRHLKDAFFQITIDYYLLNIGFFQAKILFLVNSLKDYADDKGGHAEASQHNQRPSVVV